jgi:CDP-glucose 4,6-dehydratase
MNFWKDKNVLITGVNGFVASNIAKRLNKNGANVVGLLKNISALSNLDELGISDKINVTFGDITDYHTLRGTVNKYEINVVYHLAAVSTVRICSRDPMVAFRTNVEGTWNVLEACKEAKTIQAVVVASTDKCYGVPEKLPYKEGDVLNGLATYDATKACTDIVARSYAYNYSMPISVTRCCNIYGPGDLNLSRIIPNTVRRMVRDEPAMLWSDSAEMIREFIYIDDVVDAYLAVAENIDKTRGEAYNVGTMEYLPVEDFVNKMYECIGRTPRIEIKQRESEFKEIPEQFLDCSKITKDTGWTHKYMLSDGLKKTVDWYVEFFKKLEEK